MPHRLTEPLGCRMRKLKGLFRGFGGGELEIVFSHAKDLEGLRTSQTNRQDSYLRTTLWTVRIDRLSFAMRARFFTFYAAYRSDSFIVQIRFALVPASTTPFPSGLQRQLTGHRRQDDQHQAPSTAHPQAPSSNQTPPTSSETPQSSDPASPTSPAS